MLMLLLLLFLMMSRSVPTAVVVDPIWILQCAVDPTAAVNRNGPFIIIISSHWSVFSSLTVSVSLTLYWKRGKL